MPGRPLFKILCESFTRSSNYTVRGKCKGYYQKTSKKYRCKFHSGMSTGPRTLKGRLKALKNLKSFKNKKDEEIIEWLKTKRYVKD